MCSRIVKKSECRKKSDEFLRKLSKERSLRANRSAKPETLNKYSKKWRDDKLRKMVIYNLVDLSQIINLAIKNNIEELHIPNIFPLQKDKLYGYDIEPYKNLLRGVICQITNTNLKLIWHPDNLDIIKNINN